MTSPSDVETLERREPKITAALVRLHLQVMRERYGAAVDQAVEDLEAEVRAELTALLPMQWVRITAASGHQR